MIYFIDTSVLLESTPLLKFIHIHRTLHILSIKDIDDFFNIAFDFSTVLKFVSVSSKHLQRFLASLLIFYHYSF